MKKQFLLAVLPALLVLSACSAGPKKANNVLLEDALAHEEIFGEVGNAIDLKVRKTAAQENNDDISSQPVAAKSLSAPAVGVQYQPLTNGYYAIRYVAAINDLGVEAVWTRNICKANGTRIKENDSQVPVTKAYTALASDGGVDLPADNQYYVVYTLRNIPESEVNSYLFAYLTLTNGEESVKSVARISRVSGGDTFTIDTASRHGYFLHGSIGGQAFVDVNDNGGDDNWIQESGIQMNAEDEFGLFKYEPADQEGKGEHFQHFGSYGSNSFNFLRTIGSGKQKVFHNGTYNIYLSKNEGTMNVVYFNGSISAERIYLDAYQWSPDVPLAVYAFKEWDGGKNETWYSLEATSDSNIFKADIDFSLYDKLIFCRMKSNTLSWDNNVWNQTVNIDLPNTNTINRRFYAWFVDNANSNGEWRSVDL